jgi:hypothetical protein
MYYPNPSINSPVNQGYVPPNAYGVAPQNYPPQSPTIHGNPNQIQYAPNPYYPNQTPTPVPYSNYNNVNQAPPINYNYPPINYNNNNPPPYYKNP